MATKETPAEEVTADVSADVAADARVIATGGVSAAYLNRAIDALCGKTVPAAAQFMALHTGNPADTGAAVSALARPAINWNAGAAVAGAAVTVAAPVVQWTNVAGNSATTYTHFGVWDAATGGNFLYGKALSATVNIPTGATGTINVTPSHSYDIS